MERVAILISMMIMMMKPKAFLGCSFSYFVFLDVWKIRMCNLDKTNLSKQCGVSYCGSQI